MKRTLIFLIMSLTLLNVWGKSPQEFIDSAFAQEKTNINTAFKIMKSARNEYPNNPDILSVYGYMAGLEAKETYMIRAAILASNAISAFDDALEIDPEHKNARMWRGILKINMPSFLGKVPDGILDLENIEDRADLTEEDYIMVKFFLGMGYGKAQRYEEAISSFEKVIALGKNDDYHKESIMRIERILKEKE